MKNRIPSIIAIYLSGFLQGITLILYPAAGPIFQDSAMHALSSSQYGTLFLPQIILAILSSFSAPTLARRMGMKRVLQFGLLANLFSMLLFMGSNFTIGSENLPYIVLLFGTAFLGAGFGFTITALNPFAYNLFPGKEASAVTSLHILLGLGTATASILLSFFSSLGFWWGAGLSAAVVVAGIILLTLPLPLELPKEEKRESEGSQNKIPARAWLFFVVVFLYGACEATFGNFASIYLNGEVGLELDVASLGLSIFWAAIAIGRLLFTVVALRVNPKMGYLIAPFLVGLVFFSMPQVSGETLAFLALGTAGLGLSFYFPYSISLATDEFPQYAALISGMLVAAIQLGTGISSSLVGVLQESLALSTVFQISAVYALAMAGLAIYLHLTAKPKELSVPSIEA